MHHFYDEDMDKLTNSADDYFILFTSPWCGHKCKHIEHLFQDLADTIEVDDELDLHVGIVDGTQEKGLVKEFDISDFPSMKYRCGGKTYHFPKYAPEYKDTATFLKFVRKDYFAHAKDHMKALKELKERGGLDPEMIRNHPNMAHLKKIREKFEKKGGGAIYDTDTAINNLKEGGHWEKLQEAATMQSEVIAKRMAEKQSEAGDSGSGTNAPAGVSV